MDQAMCIKVRLSAFCILLLVVSACERYAYFNQPAPTDGGNPEFAGYERSEVHPASLSVPWALDPACRAEFDWSNPEHREVDGLTMRSAQEYCELLGRANDQNFVGVALSGGGTRAAILAAAVLFEMRKIGFLDELDVVSAASGGSMTAALFGISADREEVLAPAITDDGELDLQSGKNRPLWNENEVFERLNGNFLRAWYLNRLWPDNIVLGTFTAYDTTDVFAET
jgi:hypothetical protein